MTGSDSVDNSADNLKLVLTVPPVSRPCMHTNEQELIHFTVGCIYCAKVNDIQVACMPISVVTVQLVDF